MKVEKTDGIVYCIALHCIALHCIALYCMFQGRTAAGQRMSTTSKAEGSHFLLYSTDNFKGLPHCRYSRKIDIVSVSIKK